MVFIVGSYIRGLEDIRNQKSCPELADAQEGRGALMAELAGI